MFSTYWAMIRLIILGLTAWFVMPFPGILPSLRLHRLSYARTCIFNDISKHPLSDLNSLNPKKISGPYSQSMKDKEMIRRISVKALHFAIGSAMLSSKVQSLLTCDVLESLTCPVTQYRKLMPLRQCHQVYLLLR